MSQATPASEKLAILDLFVGSSILTIVAIRFFLELTGYPQIGGNGLHIAHMLWGGIGMTVAMLYLLLTNVPNKPVISMVGGAGFGFFIDEIGKFVTADNDYFFRPAAFLIYMAILAVWLASRALIVHHYSSEFLSAAIMPEKKYQERLVLLGVLVQTGVWVFTIILSLLSDFELLGVSGVIEKLLALVLAGLIAVNTRGLWDVFHGQRVRGAQLLRLSALVSLAAVYPFMFYRDQFSAIITCLMTIGVVLALSEASLRSIFHPVTRKRG